VETCQGKRTVDRGDIGDAYCIQVIRWGFPQGGGIDQPVIDRDDQGVEFVECGTVISGAQRRDNPRIQLELLLLWSNSIDLGPKAGARNLVPPIEIEHFVSFQFPALCVAFGRRPRQMAHAN
jgi:hypothetical protein